MNILTCDFHTLKNCFEIIEKDSLNQVNYHNIEHGAIPLLPNPNKYSADMIFIDNIIKPTCYLHISFNKISKIVAFEHIYVVSKYRKNNRAKNIIDTCIKFLKSNIDFKGTLVEFTTEGGLSCYNYFQEQLLPHNSIT
jgi:hypothetical protein